MAKDPRTNIPSPRPEAKCPTCPHARNQHSRRGCIWEERRGKEIWHCPCTVTHNDLAPS